MSQKIPANTKKKLNRMRVRAEKELRAELKEQKRREKGDQAEWNDIVKTLKGVEPWKT